MTLSNFPNGISSHGVPVMGGNVPAMFGDFWFVDFAKGSDGNSGKDTLNAFKTVSKALSSATNNNNDVILVDGVSEVTEDSKLTWSNSRTHLVGLGSGFKHAQRARIGANATMVAAAVDSTIEVSGTGNSFHNIKFTNTGTDAASIACLIDSGEANWYDNCSFMKFSDLNVAAVADVICRGDSSTYTNCEIGFDTLVQSAARATFWIKNSGATRCKHLYMENCNFVCSSSAATKSFVLVADTAALAFSNVIKDCVFVSALVSSGSAAALSDAVTSVSGLVEGNILFINPVTNALEFCSAVTDQIKVAGFAMSDTNPDQSVGTALTPA